MRYYDREAGSLSPPTAIHRIERDTAHEHPSIGVTDAGYICVFAGYRNSPMKVFVSERPRDIASFKEVMVEGDYEDRYNYSQTFSIGNTIVTFARGGHGAIDVIWSDDPLTASSWQTQRLIVDEWIVPRGFCVEGDRAHLTFSYRRGGDQPHFAVGYLVWDVSSRTLITASGEGYRGDDLPLSRAELREQGSMIIDHREMDPHPQTIAGPPSVIEGEVFVPVHLVRNRADAATTHAYIYRHDGSGWEAAKAFEADAADVTTGASFRSSAYVYASPVTKRDDTYRFYQMWRGRDIRGNVLKRFESPDGLDWSESRETIDPVEAGLSEDGFGLDAFLPSPTSSLAFLVLGGGDRAPIEGGPLWAFPAPECQQ